MRLYLVGLIFCVITVLTFIIGLQKDPKKIPSNLINTSVPDFTLDHIGNGIENLGDLQSNEYAWTTISEKYLEEYKNIQIKNNSEVFKPWILIFKN